MTQNFSNQELSDKMKIAGIVQKGSVILENISKTLLLPSQQALAEEIITRLQQTITKVQKVHNFTKGVGLAAPQIGIPWRVAIVMPPKEKPLLLLNPTILNQSKKTDEQYEGCLSFFDLRGLVPRSLEIEVGYHLVDGKEIKASFRDATARLILHEIDHLNGILYPSRMKNEEKLLLYEEYKDKSKPWHYDK